MVSIDNYINDFERYKSKAIRFPGVLDVVQCGTVNNPGVSDIDVLLVIDDWHSFKPSIELLNPERVSSLFVHGPFVCKESSLSNLFLFTTLRTCEDSSYNYTVSNDDITAFAAALVRQARCFSHFSRVRLKPSKYRQVLLVGKSLMHSFDDIKRMGLHSDVLDKEHQLFLGALSSARFKMEKGNVPDEHEIISLIGGFRNLVLSGVDLIADAVANQLFLNGIDYGGRSQQELLAWFDREVVSGCLSKKPGLESSFLYTLSQWSDFYNDSISGYVNSGTLWKGGEFIFMNVDINVAMGWRIWLRRLIKRGNKAFLAYNRD